MSANDGGRKQARIADRREREEDGRMEGGCQAKDQTRTVEDEDTGTLINGTRGKQTMTTKTAAGAASDGRTDSYPQSERASARFVARLLGMR